MCAGSGERFANSAASSGEITIGASSSLGSLKGRPESQWKLVPIATMDLTRSGRFNAMRSEIIPPSLHPIKWTGAWITSSIYAIASSVWKSKW